MTQVSRVLRVVASVSVFGVAVPTIGLAQGRGAGGGRATAAPPEPLHFQYVGPPSAGRVAAVAGIPGDTMTYYIGASSGGVWKTTDGAQTFTPVFDAQDVQAIGALAVAPSEPNTVWAGTGEAWAIRDADVVGDGVYKSMDGGKTWKNMGLGETGRIGRILIHPTNPNIVFVCALGRATGPQQERGVYRTTDGGATWTRVLFVNENTGCSGITMDAHDPNVLFAGTWELVMHTWAMFSGGPGSGVYVTRDGGTTWNKITGAGLPTSTLGKIDVAVAPSDSKRVYALIQTAKDGSLWRSDDGGNAWREVSWDRTLIGRAGYYIRMVVDSKNADEVLIANSSFHRSTDGGVTFPTTDRGCGDCHDIWMDPLNGDHWIESGDNTTGITTNHARSWNAISLPIGQMYHVAVDNRYPYWIYSNRQDNSTMRGPNTSPVQVTNVPSYAMVGGIGTGPAGGAGFGGRGAGGGGGGAGAGGGGAGAGAGAGAAGGRGAGAGGRGAGGGRGGAGGGGRGGRGGAAADSTGRGAGAAPGDSVGGRGAGAGAPPDSAPSGGNGLARQAVPTPVTAWQPNLGGCESGFTLPDISDPNIVWASCYGNEVTRYDALTGRARSVSPWIHTLDSPPNEAKYRCHWTPPLATDPFDHNTVYYGCQVIFKTSNAGQSWTVISPDLSTQDPSRIVSSGGLVGDNLGQFYGEVVFAIAPSEIKRGLIWAGTNDGKLWYTTNGGGAWKDVTKNIPDLPPWGTVRKIEPSHFDPATAYVAIDFHMMDNREPYLYKTTNYGATWTKITGDLPTHHPLAYVMAITENPNRKGMLFAGTGNGFFYSLNDGAHWSKFSDGLPASPVTWIVVAQREHDVVISTYGRGLFVMHDITRLEQSDKVSDTTTAYLYAPRAGVRQARSGSADFVYQLKNAPAGPIKMEILDSAGMVVSTQPLTGRAGINRATWDLRLAAPEVVALRTTPPDNQHIWEEARFKGKATRPITHWGIENAVRAAPIAGPGAYTVRLTVDGKTLSQRFEVVKDPGIPSSDADLVASSAAQRRIVADMDTSVDIINRIEIMRRQIEDLRKADSAQPALVTSLKGLDDKMLDVELRLLSPTDFYSDDKYYVEPFRVYLNLIWLYGEVGGGAGDVQGGSEYRPTDASMQILADLERQLTLARAGFKTLEDQTVAAFNRDMAGKVPAITDKLPAAVTPAGGAGGGG